MDIKYFNNSFDYLSLHTIQRVFKEGACKHELTIRHTNVHTY